MNVLLAYRKADPSSLRRTRLVDRQEHLHKLLARIRISSPPLVDVEIADSPRTPNPPYDEPHLHFKFHGYDTVYQPFPTTDEVLTWPLLAGLVERDVPREEMEVVFNEQRDEIEHAIRNWQTRVEDQVMEIWREGHPQRQPGDSWRTEPENPGPSSKVVGALPACTLVFGKHDASTTNNINELPESHQLLLRADTIFKHIPIKEQGSIIACSSELCTYPGILPQPHMLRISETIVLGGSWDPSRWAAYPEVEELARSLLQHLGRPNATQAEMVSLRLRFFCMRCNDKEIRSWNTLVRIIISQLCLLADVSI